MLLTISYYGQNTDDLGYLLHKNPYRPQKFDLNYGSAYVFYPCVSSEKTTAALLLDINPVDLARGKAGSNTGAFDYVNDRPYVSSSFLSAAIAKVFGTAMSGRADNHQALSDSPLDLEANITMLPCRSDTAFLARVFEPLGYEVKFDSFNIDDNFPAWGVSRYVNLTIKGRVRLRDLLSHIYTLIPVFDRQKHYWIGEDEIQKLLRRGENWLPNHPEKEFITSRYLKHLRPLVNKAFAELLSKAEDANDHIKVDNEDDEPAVMPERKLNLNARRLGSVIAALKSYNVNSVIDIGCGEGNLLRLLINEKQFTKIAGTDVSYSALLRAEENLKLNLKEDGGKSRATERVKLFQSSVTYKDARLKEYGAACVIEVIEHLDLPRLGAFERVLFEYAKHSVIILTTPNREYNINYVNAGDGNLRHSDHRFEWTRSEFKTWAEKTAKQYGYSVKFSGIGDIEEGVGAPTQMGVFEKCV